MILLAHLKLELANLRGKDGRPALLGKRAAHSEGESLSRVGFNLRLGPSELRTQALRPGWNSSLIVE